MKREFIIRVIISVSSVRGISQREGSKECVQGKSNEVGYGKYIQTRRVRYLLVVQHAERFGWHAVDAPLGVPVLVAYRNGEPAVVRPYQMDQLSLTAFDLQRLALASVCGVVPLCNTKHDTFFSRFSILWSESPLEFAVTLTQLHATMQLRLAADRMRRLYARGRTSRTHDVCRSRIRIGFRFRKASAYTILEDRCVVTDGITLSFNLFARPHFYD